jgi:glucokinase
MRKIASAKPLTGLVGDVGGTHARFAVAKVTGGVITLDDPVSYRAADYPSGDEALSAYLAQRGPTDRPRYAVVAAAGPIDDGAVTFTNNPAWSFSERDLAKVGGFDKARLINDFTAQALALEHLKAKDCRRIGPAGRPPKRGTTVVLGPGTGFGAAARVDDGEARATSTTEGGHAGFSPGDDVEVEILRRLLLRFGHVSIERVLSGPGLLNLYQALAEIRGEPTPCIAPDEITRHGLAGEALCKLALERFCAILGSVAGDFALTYGARGGVYISGGIAPDIFDFLSASDFRRRFEAKGRMSDYLKPIPTQVVINPHSALIGAASQLAELTAR